MTKKEAVAWIPVLRRCLREKWNALARGKKPKTLVCAACERIHNSGLMCFDCVLRGEDGGCCENTYDLWSDIAFRANGRHGIKGAAPEAVRVRNYIRKVRAKLARRAK